jgi:hypothetical protein
VIDAIVSFLFGLEIKDFQLVIQDCYHPTSSLSNSNFVKQLNSKGLWRVDKTTEPELRSTVLSYVAFCDLQNWNDKCGNKSEAILSFLHQNDGEGWQIPEEIDLGEYGLGEGSGGRVAVRSRFGPRYFGWQESQSVEKSWRECHLHARNLLGPSGYASLLAELQYPPQASAVPPPATTPLTTDTPATTSSAPFDPDTFTLSNAPVPKKKKKR